MLSERERRLLEALERETCAADPRFARKLAKGEPWAGWRTAARCMMTVPALLVATGLGIACCALHLSSLGLLFLGWAVVGAVTWLRRRSRHQPGRAIRAHGPGRSAGWP
jgi:Protein of unknown function (DUF3040)